MMMLQKITAKPQNIVTITWSNTTMKEEHQTEDKNVIKNERSVIILGDSIVKYINGWEISERLPQCKVYVKHFSGAKTHCIKDYLKPSLRQNPSHFILHVGTSDLKSKKSSKAIAKEIMNVAISLKSEALDISVSNITVRQSTTYS